MWQLIEANNTIVVLYEPYNCKALPALSTPLIGETNLVLSQETDISIDGVQSDTYLLFAHSEADI
jgi:hypothetical protein